MDDELQYCNCGYISKKYDPVALSKRPMVPGTLKVTVGLKVTVVGITGEALPFAS